MIQSPVALLALIPDRDSICTKITFFFNLSPLVAGSPSEYFLWSHCFFSLTDGNIHLISFHYLSFQMFNKFLFSNYSILGTKASGQHGQRSRTMREIMAMSLVLAGAFFLGTKLLPWGQNSFSSHIIPLPNYFVVLIGLLV